MISLVVDASVALKWLIPEADSNQARSLRSARLFAPDLLIAECTNALWRRVRVGELSDTDAQRAWSAFSLENVEISSTTGTAPRALQISLFLDHPTYDCFYLALAEHLGIRLVTADTRLLNKLAIHPSLAALVWTLPQAAAAITLSK